MAVQRERHPIPTIEELLQEMNQSKVFSKLDIKWAYHQIELEAESRDITTRGGVEDTRLEAKAKAKDTKKIRGQGQGQGQPFRGQNLSRPRTGTLEAKAKDQGHRRKCSPKKKSSKIFFRRSPIH